VFPDEILQLTFDLAFHACMNTASTNSNQNLLFDCINRGVCQNKSFGRKLF